MKANGRAGFNASPLGFLVFALAAACADDGPENDVAPVSFASDPQTLTFGPISVPSGTERTQCVTKRLRNTDELKVGSIHNRMRGVSHHLIVYRVSDSEERPEPYDCEPFADTLSAKNGAPLMITQKSEELLELGAGLAFVLEPEQMIRLEIHYINTTDDEAMLEAESTFLPIAESEFEHAVGFLFAGSLDIVLPPGAASRVDATIAAPPELWEKKFIAFAGHTHRLGTNVSVEMGRDEAMTPVYDVDDFSWNEPETTFLDPPRELPKEGRFAVTCDYENDSASEVTFGESANAEMCFFWGYYYPSEGAFVCVETTRNGVSFSWCCPGGTFCRSSASQAIGIAGG